MVSTKDPLTSFQIEIECPCCSKEVDFWAREIFEWRPRNSVDTDRFRENFIKNYNKELASGRGGISPPTHKQIDRHDLIYAYCFGSCPKCRMPIILTISTSVADLKVLTTAATQSPLSRSIWASQYMSIEGTLPAKKEYSTPEGVPKEAAEMWPYTQKSLDAGDLPSRIVSECRSILDVCLSSLNTPKNAGRKAKIKYLKEKFILTESLARWGNDLWDDGNEAIHEIKATNENARAHVEFLKLFFRTVFELPFEIERKEQAAGSQSMSK